MAGKTGSVERRLMVLEEKLEYQDYTIEKLNDVVIAQQRQIDTMEEDVRRIGDRIEPGAGLHQEDKKNAPPRPSAYDEKCPGGQK